MINILQSWDDGVVDDIRLTALLRRYGAHADFNLIPGLCEAGRSYGWHMDDKAIWRLGRDEIAEVYAGFDIASHTMTHPDLTALEPAALSYELDKSRDVLAEWFNRPIRGFCYPFTRYDDRVMQAVQEAGYTYARGGDDILKPGCISHPYQLRPHCHFLDPYFWMHYETAKAWKSKFFFFWGHSYELISESAWQAFEQKLQALAKDPEAKWCRLPSLFDPGAVGFP